LYFLKIPAQTTEFTKMLFPTFFIPRLQQQDFPDPKKHFQSEIVDNLAV
jgi:hypothetical protein